MEQVNQAALSMMQMVTAGKSQRTESGNRTGKDENAKDFGTMLRDRQTADKTAGTAQDTVKAADTAETAPSVDPDGLEQQMLLAAMALAQSPVVILQDVQPRLPVSAAGGGRLCCCSNPAAEIEKDRHTNVYRHIPRPNRNGSHQLLTFLKIGTRGLSNSPLG